MKIAGYAENRKWTELRMSMAGQAKVDLLPPDCHQDFESSLLSVETGDQVKAVSLDGHSGQEKAIKRIYLYVPGAGEACRYRAGRGTVGSPAYLHTDPVFYACTPYLVFDEFTDDKFEDSDLILFINTDAAGTVNVYMTVEYYYK